MAPMLPVFAVVFSAAAPFQSTPLTGAIKNEAGKSLSDAQVVVVELHRETRTDRSGNFRLSNIAPGHYTVFISAVGYTPKGKVIDFPGTSSVDFQLTRSPFVIDALTVTAGRGPTTTWDATQPTSILGGEELQRNQSVSIAAAIKSLPGVRALTTGAQIGKPVIRGISGQRVLVLDQGHRMEDYSWSDEDGPSVDAAGARRVEVVRGPASLQYGSDAIGGVVNAVGDPLLDAIGTSSFHRGQAFASIASNNAEASAGLRYEGAKGSMGYRLFGVGRFGAAIHTPDGELENTGFGAFNGDAAIGFRNTRGDVSLRVAHYGGEFKLLEANGPPPGEEEGEEEGPERKAGDLRVQLDADKSMGRWAIQLKSQFQSHSLIEVSDDATGTPGTESEAFNLTLNTMSLDLSARRQFGKVSLTFGGSASNQKNDTKGPIPFVPDATTTGLAGFVLGSATFDRLTLEGGVRYDTRTVDADATPDILTTASSQKHHAVTSSTGFSFKVTDELALTAHLGRAWRAPNLFDLYANGPLLAEARFEIGDATLKPENSTTIEGGARLLTDKVMASANVYQMNIDDYIYLNPTGATQSSLPVFQHTQVNARFVGFEAALAVNPVPSLTFRAQVDGVRSTNLDADEPLPLTPPLRSMIGAEWHGERNGERTYLGVDVEMNARQKRLTAFDYPTDAYTLIGMHAGVTLHALGRPMQLDLSGRNLANTSYKDFLSRYKQFALNPGRDIRLSATLPF